MKTATKDHKNLVVDILTKSFRLNKSVQYILKDTSENRLRSLMEYSFDSCIAHGKVLLSDDLQGCALISFPKKKRTTIKSLLMEMKLVWNAIGVRNIMKVLDREKKISSNYPHTNFYYLWFIGVDPDSQGRGVGNVLLSEIISEAKAMELPIYLETSTLENLPFYKKHNLYIYKTLDFDYKLFLIKSHHQC